jgi:histone deacetylase 11
MMTNASTAGFATSATWVAILACTCILLSGCVGSGKAFSAKSAAPGDTVRAGRAVGGHVAVVYSPAYEINLGGLENLHSFDIHKYRKIYSALVNVGALAPGEVYVPPMATDEQILRVHSRAFLDSLRSSATVGRCLEMSKLAKMPSGLADAAIVSAFRRATGGTVQAAYLAVHYGIAVNLAGGYHHAKPDAGEGFCIFNDIAIAIRELQAARIIRRALVVDLDVHQGNGTAVCFAGDDEVFTFSMHEGDIYPIPKETSDLDVELQAGTDDAMFLTALASNLPALLDKAKPELVVIQAGCDTLAGDPLARMRMTPQGIVARDAMVIDECVRRRIPVLMTLGGGYSADAWRAQFMSVARTLGVHGGRISTERATSAGAGGKMAGKGG